MLTPTLPNLTAAATPAVTSSSNTASINNTNPEDNEAGSGVATFSQTLLREVAGRQKNDSSDSGKEISNPPASKAPPVKDAAKQTAQSDAAGQDDKDTTDATTATLVPTGAADMLALVNSLQPAAIQGKFASAAFASPATVVADIKRNQVSATSGRKTPSLAVLDGTSLSKDTKTATIHIDGKTGSEPEGKAVELGLLDGTSQGLSLSLGLTTGDTGSKIGQAGQPFGDKTASLIVLDRTTQGKGINTAAIGSDGKTAVVPGSQAADLAIADGVGAAKTPAPFTKQLAPEQTLRDASSQFTSDSFDSKSLPDALSSKQLIETSLKTPDLKDSKLLDSALVNNSAGPLNSAMALSPIATALASTLYGSDKLTPRVGSANWDQALGQRVVWMAGNNQQIASLTLNPPDLGPLQVVLNVSNDQASASFTAAQPEVRQALEAAMPRLREMMSDAGIQLGQTSVSANGGQQFEQFNQRQAASNQSGRSAADEALQGSVSNVSIATLQRAGRGLVDTFA